MSKARIMDFVGAVVLIVLAIVFFTRPTSNVWFKIGGGVAIAYALYCVYRGVTRADE